MTYLADVFMWCWCWLAYRLVIVMPVGRRNGPATWLFGKLLPFAGYYGFHEPWMNWRWSGRVRR